MVMGMKIVICDDLKEDREELKRVLYRFERENNLEFDILEYSDPESLLRDSNIRKTAQILFMDVYMGKVLGTDTAKRMRQMGYTGSIIFCTTSEEHALDGFRVQADGYLVKPYSYEEFVFALSRLHDLFYSKEKRISFKSDRLDYEIALSEICLIETYNKGCYVHTVHEKLFTWKRMKDFAAEIDADNFYKMGRYYLVNMDAIETINEESLILKNGFEIFMPKRDAAAMKQYINDYIWKSMRK